MRFSMSLSTDFSLKYILYILYILFCCISISKCSLVLHISKNEIKTTHQGSTILDVL